MSRPRVCYFHDQDVGRYYYGAGHPMKPHRLALTHDLVLNYGLHKYMKVYRPHRATYEEMEAFHSKEYLDFLRRVTPENQSLFHDQMKMFNVGDDCPVFDGMYDYCKIYAGASLDAAVKLNTGACDVAVSWSGGLHHARLDEASGFCYVNDIVLAILEMLKTYGRILYIDIDIHHGDGVQDAFYSTDRVMAVSFHKYGNGFFPGTGALDELGAQTGRYYSVNVPLLDGIDDHGYLGLFRPVIQHVMDFYRPHAVVLQCGADSLNCDRLGRFNLSLAGHGECVRFVKSFGLPTLVLGGGGYTIKNVSRCWTNETAIVLGQEISNDLPFTEYMEYFAPDFQLHPPVAKTIANDNTPSYMHFVRQSVVENLRSLACAPSVEMHYVPPPIFFDDDAEWQCNPDERESQREVDMRVESLAEYYDDERDHDHDGEGFD